MTLTIERLPHREAAIKCIDHSRALREAGDMDTLLYRTMPVHSILSTVSEFHQSMGEVGPMFAVQAGYLLFFTLSEESARERLAEEMAAAASRFEEQAIVKIEHVNGVQVFTALAVD